MHERKFNPKKLLRLNDPQRLRDIDPDYVLGKIKIQDPNVFVDIGAGTAFFSIAFLKHAKPSKIYAWDISDVMVNWMKENVVPKHPNIVPVKTEEVSIPLDDGIADVVFMINLHHELDNPMMTLKEAYRILKPGGNIFIIDWKKENMTQGPPTHIRCLPEQVKEQLVNVRFDDVDFFEELPKHFLVVGEKSH